MQEVTQQLANGANIQNQSNEQIVIDINDIRDQLQKQISDSHAENVKYSFSLMSIRKGARCHLDHSHTLLGIDHLEVLVYLLLSTGVSLLG